MLLPVVFPSSNIKQRAFRIFSNFDGTLNRYGEFSVNIFIHQQRKIFNYYFHINVHKIFKEAIIRLLASWAYSSFSMAQSVTYISLGNFRFYVKHIKALLLINACIITFSNSEYVWIEWIKYSGTEEPRETFFIDSYHNRNFITFYLGDDLLKFYHLLCVGGIHKIVAADKC